MLMLEAHTSILFPPSTLQRLNRYCQTVLLLKSRSHASTIVLGLAPLLDHGFGLEHGGPQELNDLR